MRSNSRRDSGSSASGATSVDQSDYSTLPASQQIKMLSGGRKLRANSTDIDKYLKHTIKKCETIQHEKFSIEQRMFLEKTHLSLAHSIKTPEETIQ
jgi:predicted ribonuclease YlaK